jgi:hypothetical protein
MPVQMIELEEVQIMEASDDALEAAVGGQLYSLQCMSAHCS